MTRHSSIVSNDTSQKTSAGSKAQAKDRSFFKPTVQSKLSINQPNDIYEQEADAVAEKVMRMPVVNTEPAFFSPKQLTVTPVQRKCATCEEGEKLQRKEDEDEPVQMKPEKEFDVQRKCDECSEKDELQRRESGQGKYRNNLFLQRFAVDCSMFTKKEEEIDADDAKEEGLADPATATGGGEVQRKCETCGHEGGGEYASNSFASQLESTKGGGNQLPVQTRSFFENRFDADFSGVRVHSDHNAASMSSNINAHAFTHGQDIYFNNGQYNSSNSDGQKLLAHELTHVVQQSGDKVQRKKQQTGHKNFPDIQRSFYFTSSPNKVSGSDIHATILPAFVKANPTLFMEVSIPGANKKDTDKGKTGVADFYKASTTIGIKFNGEPEPLRANADFQAGASAHASGAKFSHSKFSAPKGSKQSPRAERMDKAASDIEIGDLKPGASSESILGQGQVQNYITGITNTQTDLNAYLKITPKESDTPVISWTSKPTPMKSLTIPNDLNFITGSGIKGLKDRELALWREGDKRPYVDHVGFKGSVFVYKDRPEGVWSYEWIPNNVPATTGSKEANTVVDRLNTDVIPALTATGGTSITPKRAAPGVYTIMRKEEKFSDEDWKKNHFKPWKSQAVKFLGDKNEVKKAEVAVGIVEVEKRTGATVNAPQGVKEQGKGLPKIAHWKRFGGFYGWIREKFDWLFVKVKGLADKIKKKVQDLSKKAGSTAFGSWIKALAKVVFKIFKMVGTWVVTQVLDKLVNSLREGIINNIKKLVEKAMPDDAKVYLEKFCALKEKYDVIIAEKEEALTTMLFGDKLKMFEAAEAIEEKIGYVADIVSLIEWGIRILACASPPAVGCLWNLLTTAIQWAFSKLIQTCWFTKEVYGPVINKVDLVKNFPAQLASGMVDKFNEALPVPDGLDKWFAPITINNSDFSINCNEAGDGSGKLDGDRKAIFDIAKEPGGDEKLKAALQLMKKRGAGPWVLLTKERAAELKTAFESTTAPDMIAAVDDKTKPIPAGMKPLMDKVGSYSTAEKKLIAEARAAKEEKAEREALKKVLDEMNKDPKVQEALAKPYPSDSDLRKDMETYTGWGNVYSGYPFFTIINGHTVVLLKTKQDKRLGAYFKYYEKTAKSVVKKIVLETGRFYMPDGIEAFDTFSYFTLSDSTDSTNMGSISMNYFRDAIPKQTFHEMKNIFFNTSVIIE